MRCLQTRVAMYWNLQHLARIAVSQQPRFSVLFHVGQILRILAIPYHLFSERYDPRQVDYSWTAFKLCGISIARLLRQAWRQRRRRGSCELECCRLIDQMKRDAHPVENATHLSPSLIVRDGFAIHSSSAHKDVAS